MGKMRAVWLPSSRSSELCKGAMVHAQIIIVQGSKNASGSIVKWHAWGRLGKVMTLAGVIWRGLLVEVPFELD